MTKVTVFDIHTSLSHTQNVFEVAMNLLLTAQPLGNDNEQTLHAKCHLFRDALVSIEISHIDHQLQTKPTLKRLQ